MAGEWRERPLGELIENLDSVRVPVKKADRRAGCYPYYGASGIVDYVDTFLFDGEYLLIAEDGENLRTRNTPVAFLARGKFWVNNHAHIVRGNAEADTRFLMYALAGTNIGGYLTGSTMPKLTQGNMNRILLLAPPANEQRAIANILGSLDDKIELNRRMNKTLETMAQATFKSWFVDFAPVHAKAEGRETGLPKAVAEMFPDSFDDSELGEIPMGWGIQRLSDMIAIARDMVNPADFPEEAFCHYSIPAYDECRFPSEEVGDTIKSGKFIVSPSSVLISKLNPRIPRIWMPTLQSDKRSICSTEFLVAIPKAVSREYLYCLFSSPDFVAEFTTMVTGTSGSHQRVKAESFLEMKAIRPPTACVEKFTSFIAPLFRSIANNILHARSLAGVRDALLPKLLAGEIRVKDAERIARRHV